MQKALRSAAKMEIWKKRQALENAGVPLFT